MKFFARIFFTGVVVMLPVVAVAQNQSGNSFPNQSGNSAPNQSGNSLSGLQNPLQAKTICEALKLFLNALLTLAIPVAVLFLVYAGFSFVWARGSEKGLTKAKKNLFYTVIGIAIFLGAWLLGQIIANTINSLTGQAGSGVQITSCNV